MYSSFSVALARNNISQSDIWYGLTTNTPPQAIPYVREKLNFGFEKHAH